MLKLVDCHIANNTLLTEQWNIDFYWLNQNFMDYMIQVKENGKEEDIIRLMSYYYENMSVANMRMTSLFNCMPVYPLELIKVHVERILPSTCKKSRAFFMQVKTNFLTRITMMNPLKES